MKAINFYQIFLSRVPQLSSYRIVEMLLLMTPILPATWMSSYSVHTSNVNSWNGKNKHSGQFITIRTNNSINRRNIFLSPPEESIDSTEMQNQIGKQNCVASQIQSFEKNENCTGSWDVIVEQRSVSY